MMTGDVSSLQHSLLLDSLYSSSCKKQYTLGNGTLPAHFSIVHSAGLRDLTSRTVCAGKQGVCSHSDMKNFFRWWEGRVVVLLRLFFFPCFSE